MNKKIKLGLLCTTFILSQKQGAFALDTSKDFQSGDQAKTQAAWLNSDFTLQNDLTNKSGEIIPGSYIVVFSSNETMLNSLAPEKSAQFVQAQIQELSRNYKFDIGFQYSSSLHGFAAKMTEKEASLMAQDSRIERLEPDRTVVANLQVTAPGMIRIGADKSSTIAGDGKGRVLGVDVYIIDTGIDLKHTDLTVVGGKNFSTGSSYADLNGHGTHVAGIVGAIDNTEFVVGAAPGVNLYSVRVLNAAGSGSFTQVLAGVDWVTKQKKLKPQRPAVANISLGAKVNTTAYNSLDVGIKNSIAAGVVYAIAAGNSAMDASKFSPAHVKEAMTVGAYDASTNIFASFSNFGPVVDFLAPGVKVLSTYKDVSTATLSGTSMASPHVAGAAALYLSTHPAATPALVRSAIAAAAAAPAPGPNPSITAVPAATTSTSIYEGNF